MSSSATLRPLVASTVVPPTQNTAPVLEFRCLYTSDLRRKQKRWQDGRLKYHTFNKRVMVYDERGNFVGDTHWQGDYSFEEGEDIELEKNGLLVQVSECIGSREQDLSELLDKRLKEREERSSVRDAVSSPLQTPSGPGAQVRTVLSRLQGQALPSRLESQTSPFQFDKSSNTLPSAKRRKPNSSPPSKNGYAQNLTGATLSLSMPPMSSALKRQDRVWAQLPGKHREVDNIDLINDSQLCQEPVYKTNQIAKSPDTSNLGRGGYTISTAGANFSSSGQQQTRYSTTATLRRKVEFGSPEITMNPPPEPAVSYVEERLVDAESFNTAPLSRGGTKPNPQHYRAKPTSPKSSVTSHRVDLPASHFPRQLPIVSRTRVVEEEESLLISYCERPSNPLRLKSRPKKKLLYMSDPQCWSAKAVDKSATHPPHTLDHEKSQSGILHEAVSQAEKEPSHSSWSPDKVLDQRESEINESFTIFEKTDDSHLGKRDSQSWIGNAKLLMSGEKPKQKVCQRVSENRNHHEVDGVVNVLVDHAVPAFLQENTSRRDPHHTHKSQLIQPAASINARPTVDDNDASSAAKCGLDHLAIDTLLSRHISAEPTKKKICTGKSSGKDSTSRTEISSPFPQNWRSTRNTRNSTTSEICLNQEATNSVEKLAQRSMHMTFEPRKESREAAVNVCLGDGFTTAARSAGKSIISPRTSLASQSPPRVVKILNGGKRSKEVVGFVLPVEESLKCIDAPPQTIVEIVKTGEQRRFQPPAKLVNPATRGRKAASKADAAGKVPEMIVPPTAPMGPPPALLVLPEGNTSQDNVSLRPYYFSTKEGGGKGPWSREAFDLFDWRPKITGIAEVG